MADDFSRGPAVDRGPCRTVLVSGASRGIGQAVAWRLLAQGHRLSLGLRQTQSAEEWLAAACARCGDPFPGDSHPLERLLVHPYEALSVDAAADGPETWLAATLARWGGVEAVIHCAGIFSRLGLCCGPEDDEEIRTVLDVNLIGPWRLSRAAWPHLAASGDGRVITVVSMSGKRVRGNLAAYSASKFALLALCQTMRNEGWHQGIRVTAVCPSWVNTGMAAAVTALPREAMTQPGDLASSIAHLVSLPPSAVPFEFNVSCQLEI